MTPTGTIYCEFTGQVADAMTERGLDVISCDLLPRENGRHDRHHQGDAYQHAIRRRGDAIAGLHWPCTYFTNAGVRWLYHRGTRDKVEARWKLMLESAGGVAEILNHWLAWGTPFYFENPIMHKYAREAIIARCPWFGGVFPQIVQPWNFGTWETKATCLWTFKLCKLKVKYETIDQCRRALGLPLYVGDKLNKPHAKVHLATPGADRWKERSRTLPTLANAMAEQWSEYLLNK